MYLGYSSANLYSTSAQLIDSASLHLDLGQLVEPEDAVDYAVESAAWHDLTDPGSERSRPAPYHARCRSDEGTIKHVACELIGLLQAPAQERVVAVLDDLVPNRGVERTRRRLEGRVLVGVRALRLLRVSAAIEPGVRTIDDTMTPGVTVTTPTFKSASSSRSDLLQMLTAALLRGVSAADSARALTSTRTPRPRA